MINARQCLWGCVLGAVVAVAGCASSETSGNNNGSGGVATTSGGASGTGSGGNSTGSGSGGTVGGGSGGATGTGGRPAGSSGGSSATGGRTGSGGATVGSSGGATGSGGAPAAGGSPGTIMRVDLSGKKVLLIVGDPASPNTGDAALRDTLVAKSMTVTMVDATAVAANAATMNLIIGSDTAGSGWPALYKDMAVPMIVFGNSFDFALGFTATSSAKGNASTPVQITIIDATSPLAAAFDAGLNVAVIGTTRNTQIYWATPGGSPIRVASVMGAASELDVFAYEKGAAMAVGTAAARRVVLGWKTDLVEKDLAIEAFRIMNAAIVWTATAP